MRREERLDVAIATVIFVLTLVVAIVQLAYTRRRRVVL
jgi:ABC-type sugar transport system permease subunit